MFTTLAIAMTLSGAAAVELPSTKAEASSGAGPACGEAASFGKGNIRERQEQAPLRQALRQRRPRHLSAANLAEPPGGKSVSAMARAATARRLSLTARVATAATRPSATASAATASRLATRRRAAGLRHRDPVDCAGRLRQRRRQQQAERLPDRWRPGLRHGTPSTAPAVYGNGVGSNKPSGYPTGAPQGYATGTPSTAPAIYGNGVGSNKPSGYSTGAPQGYANGGAPTIGNAPQGYGTGQGNAGGQGVIQPPPGNAAPPNNGQLNLDRLKELEQKKG